jgi:hypothetical protein
VVGIIKENRHVLIPGNGVAELEEHIAIEVANFREYGATVVDLLQHLSYYEASRNIERLPGLGADSTVR